MLKYVVDKGQFLSALAMATNEGAVDEETEEMFHEIYEALREGESAEITVV